MRFLPSLSCILGLICLGIFACNAPEQSTTDKNAGTINVNGAEVLLRLTAEAHGFDAPSNISYSFTFRNKRYSFNIDEKSYNYQVEYTKNDSVLVDAISNHDFTRSANGQKLTLSKKQRSSGFENLNSVLYFATLPHRLKDQAVKLERRTPVNIKGISYDVLAVSFEQAGGGTDYEDEYRYWINAATHRIEYLAYNYKVNKGGVRFREAFNTREVAGTVFQDYNNFKATVGTPLDSLPFLFQQGQLELLSQILTEDVKQEK